jgi:hypothetical protein
MASSKLWVCGLTALAARWPSPIQIEIDWDKERGDGFEDCIEAVDHAHGLEACSRALAHGCQQYMVFGVCFYSLSWTPTLSILERVASMAFNASTWFTERLAFHMLREITCQANEW